MSKPIKILTEIINYSINVINQKYSIAVESLKYNIAIDHVAIADPPPAGIGTFIIESTFIVG